jgi:hypothetical protein
MAASGFGMVIVGGLALYSLKMQNTTLLKLVLLLDVALFTFVLGAAIIGIMLGLDIRDPVREAATRAWGDYSPRLASQRESRLVIWDGQACTKNLVSVCEENFASEATAAIRSPHSNYTEGQNRVRDLFADCEYARQGLKCITEEDDEPTCAGRNLNGSPEEDLAQCETLVTGTYNGCQYIAAAGDTQESCVPKPDCAASIALQGFCETCNHECREFSIDQAKSNLLPAAHLVYGIFAFCMICILINDKLTSPDGMDGIWKSLGLFFHGLVSVAGLGLAIAAMVGQYYLSEECPGEDIATCTNPAIWIVCALGLALLVVGAIGVYVVQLGVDGASGFIALAPLNMVLLGIALPLLVCGLFLSISAGAVDTVHTTFDKHYPEMRKSIESQDADYCSTTGSDGGLMPMTDAECRAKMTAALEDQVLVVGAIACACALGLFAVTVLTKHVVTAWSRGDDEDSSGSQMLNPLDEE